MYTYSKCYFYYGVHVNCMQLTKNINTPNFVSFYQQFKFYLLLTTTHTNILRPDGAFEIFALTLSDFTQAIWALFIFHQ